MSIVRVLKVFKRRGEILPPGSIIEVPDNLLPQMAGLVEIVPRRQPDPPTTFKEKLAEEADRRTDFCWLHRATLGGACERFNVVERLTPGAQSAALDSCLLWALICAGEKIEQASSAEIMPGITVGDVLRWVDDPRDTDAIRRERRLLLTAAASLRNTIH